MNKPVPQNTNMNHDYLAGCAVGELRLRQCGRCSALFRFAHDWCPECWSAELGWIMASGKGHIGSFSVVHQAPYEAFEDMVPYVLALIELDEGVRMMSNVIHVQPEDVRIGMPVHVVFEERSGVWLPMFVPD